MRMTEEEFANLMLKNPKLSKAEFSKTVENKKKVNGTAKYKNKKVYVYADDYASYNKADGHGNLVMTFDSTKEYERWCDLIILQKQRQITDLERQKVFLIQEAFKYNNEKIKKIEYKADFYYIKDGITIVEDVKPFDKKRNKFLTTKDFNLKWKLLKHKYPEISFNLI